MELFSDNAKNLAFFHHKMKRDLFDVVSYQTLLNQADKHSDFYRFAMNDVNENPELDLELPMQDLWLQRLKLLLNTPSIGQQNSKQLKQVYRDLTHDRALSDSQQIIFSQLAQNKALFATITGQAGSGKSYLTAQLIKHLVTNQLQTAVLTPTHVASTNINQLIDQAREVRFDQDMTANKLQAADRSDMISVSTLTSWMFRMAADSMEIAQHGQLTNNDQRTAPQYDLIVIDEAFAANAIGLLDVFLFALLTSTPVILIGDPHQLSAIQNPPQPLFDLLRQAKVLFDTDQLQLVQRTNSNEIIHFSRAILNNNLNDYKEHYFLPNLALPPAALLATSDFDTEVNLENYLSQTFMINSKDHGLDSIILVPTNEKRRQLAEQIQSQYLNQDPQAEYLTLSGEHMITMYVGDIMMIMESQLVHDWTSGHPSKETLHLRGATRIEILDLFPNDENGEPVNRVAFDTITPTTYAYKIQIRVPDLDNQKIIVDLMERSSSGFNPGMYSPDVHELYRDLELGYVATVNKVQGLSINHVYFYLDRDYPHLNRNLIYSGVTRARQSIQLIVDPQLLRNTLAKKF